MDIHIRKLTDESLMRHACSATMKGKESKMTLSRIYRNMHSPIRTQLFWITMDGIPSFCSVHFVRHSVGVTHFVGTNREDRGGELANRLTPINHSMLINAEALINMARKRLCSKASPETREIMEMIVEAIKVVDPELAPFLVRECKFRNGICPEDKCCMNLYKPEI